MKKKSFLAKKESLHEHDTYFLSNKDVKFSTINGYEKLHGIKKKIYLPFMDWTKRRAVMLIRFFLIQKVIEWFFSVS